MNPTHTTLEQIIFTKVRDHLLVQGRHAVEAGTTPRVCKYREGRRSCAIGCLISDENYGVGEIEGISIRGTSMKKRRLLLEVLDDEGLDVPIPFLETLQNIHDSFKAKEWRRHLAEFAQEHNLEWEPEPEGTRL